MIVNMRIKVMGIIGLTVVLATLLYLTFGNKPPSLSSAVQSFDTPLASLLPEPTPHPLSIHALSSQTFVGSDLAIEQTLSADPNYQQYIASYTSEGNKIYGLLTIPQGSKPPTGWPLIVFNHGYIPPAEYRTTERYGTYVGFFASRGYMVFKSDYRGHGNSQGEASGGYGSNSYTIDVLNAVATMKKHPDVDPARIGMWGHSMGGFITLRNMVVSQDVKVGVIWAGVVPSI